MKNIVLIICLGAFLACNAMAQKVIEPKEAYKNTGKSIMILIDTLTHTSGSKSNTVIGFSTPHATNIKIYLEVSGAYDSAHIWQRELSHNREILPITGVVRVIKG